MEKVEQKVSDCLFYDGANHEPLSDKTRAWLVKQLAAYPERVDENNTCAGGALQKLATCDYPHVIEATRANDEEIARLREALESVFSAIGQMTAPKGHPVHKAFEVARKALGDAS